MVLGAAPLFEPTHVGGVAAGNLHPVDAQVANISFVTTLLGRLRTLGDHERPCDQRGGFSRPAGLDREPCEVDLVAFPNHLLTRCGGNRLRFHRHHRLDQGKHFQSCAPAVRRLGLAEKCEQLANLAQLRWLAIHSPCNSFDGSEQIDQNGHLVAGSIVPDDMFEKYRRSALGEQPGLNLGHFQDRRYGFGHANQPALPFQMVDKIAKRPIGHDAPFQAWVLAYAARRPATIPKNTKIPNSRFDLNFARQSLGSLIFTVAVCHQR